MKRHLAVALFGATLLAGCPDNPYKASTWTKQLKDPHEQDRALTELERLCDPSAISALGDAWRDSGRPPRMLQVIIGLAAPLSPKEAEAKFCTDYQTDGRKASWDDAIPYLKEAVTGVDELAPKSVESATHAAEALGATKVADTMEPLAELAKKPITSKLLNAQVAAAQALGKFDNDPAKAVQLLSDVINSHDVPPVPKQGDKVGADKLTDYLRVTGSAINAMGDLRTAAAAKFLVLQMYKTPALFAQIRRALVASGPAAEDELRKILRGEHAEVNQLVKDKKYDVFCGDHGEVTPCLPVGAKDFYPAVVLGDFYDPKSVPDLLVALKRPLAPQYYQDADNPSDATNYTAILDSLRKIGSSEAEPVVRAIWAGGSVASAGTPAAPKGPAKGPAGKGKTPAAPTAEAPAAGAGDNGTSAELDIRTKTFAISVYPFVARGGEAAAALVQIADGKVQQPAGVDLQQWNALRQEASTAFARLSTNPADVDVLMRQAQVQFDAAAKQHDIVVKEKPKFDAAEASLKQALKDETDTKAAWIRASHESKDAGEISKLADLKKKAEDNAKEEKLKHRAATGAYNDAVRSEKALTGFGRLFQSHTARIVVAQRCSKDPDVKGCYTKTLAMKPDDAVKDCDRYIKGLKDWSPDEKMGLLEGEIERAMLELGKMGQAASGATEAMLDAAKTDDRVIRQSVLLALPKVAKVPCDACEDKLNIAIKAGAGKMTVQALQLDTEMLANYFSWAGGRTPNKSKDKDSGGGGGSDAATPPAKQ
jgi:hypothetical protein|nr:hypothetical protein [Kofleriaceae bacterium]